MFDYFVSSSACSYGYGYDTDYKNKNIEIEAIYNDGKADGAEEIINAYGLKNEYHKYCDKRDKGKSHSEIISKLK